MRLAISHASRPRPGEQLNGDAVLVRRKGGLTLLAVVDALGHGPLAAAAARAAVQCLEQVDLAAGVLHVLDALHASQAKERGAVAVVGLFDGERLSCAGVGNVELRTQGVRLPLVLSPGILGQRYRRPVAVEAALQPGDRLVAFTDGLASRTDLDSVRGLAPAEACATLMERYAREQDDASILIAELEHDT